MSARGSAVLYTPAILALAVELGQFILDDGMLHRGEARARICGSQVLVGMSLDARGAILRAGARVTACAIGQAAAALFLRAASGHDRAEIDGTLKELEVWLAGEGAMPRWPEIALLDAARAYPGRHPAILLPWKAALVALSNPATAS